MTAPKRLVVCCDGTWNTPDELRDGASAPTNVSKIALGLAREDAAGGVQRLFYQRGVGTRRFEHLRGGAIGFGLSRNVRDCYRFIVENYEPGDELYFFGFSRGAYTARSTAGFVRNAGILRPEHRDRVDEAYALYRSRDSKTKPSGIESEIFRRMYSHEETKIEFVGVWDTVGALGIPIGGLRLPFVQHLWGFHDTKLSTYVRAAYQALALDEHRSIFKPTTWTRQPESGDQILEQVWFAGVHSDVGGGYQDPALAEIPLLWMVANARRRNLVFEPGHFAVQAKATSHESRCKGEQVAPDPLGAIHESRTGPYRLLPSFQRQLADRDGQSASSSARHRLEANIGYESSSLAGWVKAGGRITVVQEGP